MNRTNLIVTALCVSVAIASFLITRAAQPPASADAPRSALLDWLQVSASQRDAIHRDDPGFEAESAALMTQLREHRHALALLLEKEDAQDQQVLEQVARVSDVEAHLERRIAEYVLRIRQHLTSQQRRELLGLCAKGIRGENRCRWCQDADQCKCK